MSGNFTAFKIGGNVEKMSGSFLTVRNHNIRFVRGQDGTECVPYLVLIFCTPIIFSQKIQTSVLTGHLDFSHPTHPPLVSGTRSAFSPVQPRAATGNNIRNGVHINGSNIIGPNCTGLDRNSATALRENDPQRPQSYATASKGFWPVPGEEDFPPLP